MDIETKRKRYENEKGKKNIPLPRFYLMERRLELGYSCEQVSRLIGKSQYYYFQLENGSRGKNLTVKLLLALIEGLQMEPSLLLEQEAEYIDNLKRINNN